MLVDSAHRLTSPEGLAYAAFLESPMNRPGKSPSRGRVRSDSSEGGGSGLLVEWLQVTDQSCFGADWVGNDERTMPALEVAGLK